MQQLTNVFLAWMICGIHLATSRHPNVLLIMVDDLRPALGCYGDPTAFTPNLDALAKAGVTFTKAYAQQALCGPSRTSLLTSRRPATTGVIDVHHYWRTTGGNFTTLPQHFKQHGYYTASAGKIFHPGIVSNHSDDSPYSWSATPYHPSTMQYKNAKVCGQYSNSTDIVCPVVVEQQPEQSLPDLQTTHYAIAFLRRWAERQGQQHPAQQQPLFLAVGYHKPHIPLKFPKEFLDLHPLPLVPLPPDRQLPPRLPPVAYNPWNDLRWRDDVARLGLQFPYQPMPDHYARRIIQSYYAATSYTDFLIGELLAVAARLLPDTVVAMVGDHGWSLGEHQEWSKFSNYEVATRVPLVFASLQSYSAARRGVWRALGARSGKAVRHKLRRYRSIRRQLVRDSDSWKGNRGVDYEEYWNFDVESNEDVANSTLKRVREFDNRSAMDDDVNNIDNTSQKHLSVSVATDLRNSIQQIQHAPAIRMRSENEGSVHWSRKCPIKSGYTYDGIVELVDIFPTLADLAGIQKVPTCLNVEKFNNNIDFSQGEFKHKVRLCTEGHSLSSIIIAQNKPRKVKYNKPTHQPLYEFQGTNKLEHQSSKCLKPNSCIIYKNHSAEIKSRYVSNKFCSHAGSRTKKLKFGYPSGMDFGSRVPLLHPSSKCCHHDLSSGRVAISQYPRPTLQPSQHPDSDQPRLSETTVMGYSFRSLCYRYTLWVAFNATAFAPDFREVVGEELYDHRVDPREDRNVLWGVGDGEVYGYVRTMARRRIMKELSNSF